jgi:hypothetical protein
MSRVLQRGAQPGAGKRARAQHADPQPPVLRRALRHATRGERREPQGRASADHQPEAERQVGPQRRDEHKAREHRPRDAAHGVHGIGAPHVFCARAAAPRHEIRQEGEGHPHPDRGDEHDPADREAQGHEALDRAERLHLEDGNDVAGEQVEEREQQRRPRRRHPLRDRGIGGGLGSGGAAAGDERAAQADPQQEHEQHQREGVRRAPDDHHEHARPRDLVEQGGERRHTQEREPHRAERVIRLRGGGQGAVGDRGHGDGDGWDRLERARQHERRRAEAQVHHRGGPDARADAHVLDQEKPGERRARHGAQRVRSVEQPQRRLQAVARRAHERPGQDGERPSHQRGRNEQHQRGEREPQRHAHAPAQAERSGGAHVHAVRQRQHEGGQEAEHADRDLEPPVQRRRPGVAVAAPTQQPGAQPEAAHVGGHDGGH